MFTVSDYDIAITKGDTGIIELNLELDGVTEDYSICIEVREYADGPLLFTGDLVDIDGALIWYIHPDDTANASYRTYFWDCYIEIENDEENYKQHITELHKFKVLPFVTEPAEEE